jgi:hypothetical protein
MASSKPNPRSGDRATTQTIDQIEAQAAAIEHAECAVMQDLAAWLRERAVELPVESKLPMRFAKAAKDIELFTGGSSAMPEFAARRGVQRNLVDKWGHERCEELRDLLDDALRRTGF